MSRLRGGCFDSQDGKRADRPHLSPRSDVAAGSATRFHDPWDALALTRVRGLRGPKRTKNTVRIMFSGPYTRRRSQVRCR